MGTLATDEDIERQVLDAVRAQEGGRVVVNTDGGLAESLGLTKYSNTKIKRIVGRLVRDDRLVRSRPEPEHLGHDYRPITYRLP